MEKTYIPALRFDWLIAFYDPLIRWTLREATFKTREAKIRTFKEIERVLKPGGELHVADFGKPQNSILRVLFYAVQFLDGFETTTDNVRGVLQALIAGAGFEAVERCDERATPLGTIALYAARRPEVM